MLLRHAFGKSDFLANFLVSHLVTTVQYEACALLFRQLAERLLKKLQTGPVIDDLVGRRQRRGNLGAGIFAVTVMISVARSLPHSVDGQIIGDPIDKGAAVHNIFFSGKFLDPQINFLQDIIGIFGAAQAFHQEALHLSPVPEEKIQQFTLFRIRQRFLSFCRGYPDYITLMCLMTTDLLSRDHYFNPVLFINV